MSITIRSEAPLARAARAAYLLTLAYFQGAVLVNVAPPLAALLARDVHALGADAPSLVRAAAYALTLAGASIALAFPTLALARHAQRGRCRFRGLPRSWIGVALTGALLHALAQIATLAARFAPASIDIAVLGAAPVLANAGIALMAAGALVAEVLRRSIAPVRVPIAPWHCQPVRVEVIDPPELATRGV